MIKVETFKPVHYDEIMDCGPRMNSIVYLSERSKLVPIMMLGPAITTFGDKGIIGSAGVIPLSPGIGESWLLATREIERYPIQVARIVRRILGEMADSMGLHRIQTKALETSNVDCRWLEWLGFEREGIMRAYMPDRQNAVLYSKLLGV